MFLQQAVSGAAAPDATIGDDTGRASTMSYLDTLYSNFDIAAAMDEKREAEKRAAEARDERDAADVKMRKAIRRANMAEAAIAGFRAWQEAQGGGATDKAAASDTRADSAVESAILRGGSQVATGAPGGSKSPTGRASVNALIDNGPDDAAWTIPSMAEALGVGPEAHHAIGVSAQRLARDGKIARPRKGTYTKLPSATVTPAAEEGREMRLNGSQEGPG
jgi:hypothetical protein